MRKVMILIGRVIFAARQSTHVNLSFRSSEDEKFKLEERLVEDGRRHIMESVKGVSKKEHTIKYSERVVCFVALRRAPQPSPSAVPPLSRFPALVPSSAA